VAQWDAEVVVDEPLVRRLLRQFPELALESVELLSEGWDRSMWLVDGEWVFGFARRAVAVPGIERELLYLPTLAPLLPLPIPNPIFVGAPSKDFAWPFFGSRYLSGTEATGANVTDRRTAALELAAFLRVLHGDAVREAVDFERLPRDHNKRADLEARLPRARAILAELSAREVPPRALAILAEAERLPPSRDETVVHGDLHARQVLVHDSHVSGVIDWVDLGRADPAIDLQVLWSFVEPRDRSDFLAVYGPADDERLLRARVTALWLSAVVAQGARGMGADAAAVDQLAALERAATE
jgi:aminoglycoside phosphotransferase (APT) family kinase protein